MINEKISYFIDYWRDITYSNSIEENLIHVIIYNPKIFFREFSDEIKRKNLKNSENKKFFIENTRLIAKLDLEALKFLKPTLKLIQQQFDKQDTYEYLLHLLDVIQIELSNFQIAKEAVIELAEILTDESSLNKLKIKQLTNFIISELMQKKYSKQTIIKIVDYIFSSYQLMPANYIHTNFPHQIKCENHDSTSEEFQKYQEELKTYIDNLTLKERILSFNNYFNTEPEKSRYIFQIKGLKGDNVNLTIGNVQIYNPRTMKLCNNQMEDVDELFDATEFYYCNGAVKVDVIDSEFGKYEAMHALNKVLDVLASHYTNYKIPFKINENKHYIIDEDGNHRGSSFNSTWEYIPYSESIEIENENYEYLAKFYGNRLFEDNLLLIDKKIIESIHWKRKAIESIEHNEKILWQWVALENLFENPSRIFEVVSKQLAKKQLYVFAWKYFDKLSILTRNTSFMEHFKMSVNLSNKLKDDLGLNIEKGEVYLNNLIDNIESIKNELDQNSLLFEQFVYLNDIFTDTKQCLNLLATFEKIVYEKLLFTYRIRNKIVHNASNDNTPTLDYYVNFITSVTAAVVSEFVNKRESLNLKSNIDIINNIIYDYEKFKIELNEYGTQLLKK